MSEHDVPETTPPDAVPAGPDAPAAQPEGAATQPDPTAAASEGPPPISRGVVLTPRRLLIAMAIVLAIVLVLLIIYLLLISRQGVSTRVTGEPMNGIKAERVIVGPGQASPTPLFSRPMGAAWDSDGDYLYVADSENNRICAFSKDGRFMTEFGRLGVAKPLPGAKITWDPGELSYPVDVALDDRDHVYVADFYNDSISVFTSNGDFLNRFPDPYKPTGKGGSGSDGKGIAVTAVATFEDKVYATDTYQVLVFSNEGELLLQFGKPGGEAGSFDHPNGIAVTDDGVIVVSDSNNNRVQGFDQTGRLLWSQGQQLPANRKSSESPVFILPRGITPMEAGSLLVADPLAHQLVEISEEGGVIESYGTRGVAAGALNFPNDVDWHDGRILVADRENQRVQIVRLVPK